MSRPTETGPLQSPEVDGEQVFLADRRGQIFQHAGDGTEMLLGEDLGGGHQGALESGCRRRQESSQGHHGFAAAHLALEQPVHRRRAAPHVSADFGDAASLGAGQLEWQ